MSRDFSDGFDRFSNGTALLAAGKYTASNTSSVMSTTTPFSSGRSADIFSGTATTSVLWPNRSTQWLAVHVFRQNSGSCVSSVSLADNSTAQITFFLNNANLEIRSGTRTGTLLGTLVNVFPFSVWTHLIFRVIVSNTVGRVEVYVNGNPAAALTLTNVNTRGGTANAFVNNVTYLGTAATASFLIDDVFIWNEDGTAPSGWIGQPRCVTVAASTAGASTTFATRVGAATNALANAQVTGDGETSYVADNVVGRQDLYVMAALGVTPTNIFGLDYYIHWRKEDAGARTGALRRRSSTGASEVNIFTNAALSVSYVQQSFWEPLNPDTGVAFTVTTLPQLGPRIEA